MKDEIKDKLAGCHSFDEIRSLLDEQINYYNQNRYQWKLAKLSPNEFYEHWKSGDYPLKGVHVPECALMSDQAKPVISACKT